MEHENNYIKDYHFVNEQIHQALSVALAYGYYETSRKHIEHGLQSFEPGSCESGRLYQTEGVLSVLEALYGKTDTGGSFAHAALSLMAGACLSGKNEQCLNALAAESLKQAGFDYLGDLYSQATNTPTIPLSTQIAHFPHIRNALFKI